MQRCLFVLLSPLIAKSQIKILFFFLLQNLSSFLSLNRFLSSSLLLLSFLKHPHFLQSQNPLNLMLSLSTPNLVM
ncbi:hypothetical protein REPUB_Repub02eG0173300 [Reevesia pubescens]